WEICGDSSKDYTDLTLKRGQMLPQHHIVVVGEDVDRDGKRYYVIDNTPSIGLEDAGEVVAYGYEKVKPDRFNCNTVFVSEENGEERIETVAGAYDDTGKKNEFADFPWILTRYIELTQPSIDLEQYYEDDKRKMLKLIN
ncbi:MAG: hypothetical protein Q4F96_00280, partial [Bacillota bacterium]|nr:hypothetical protein [Bacillota bacterium]